MTKDEVSVRSTLKLALEALEFVNKSDDDCDFMNSECAARVEDAMTAIKEALAQPAVVEPHKQEPVPSGVIRTLVSIDKDGIETWKHEPFYTTPPPVPEAHKRTWVHATEWRGLTDEDKQTAFDETQEGGGFWEFADAIEAKLRSKNT